MNLFLIHNVMNLLLRIPCGSDDQQPCFTFCGLERLLVIPKNMCYAYYLK